MAVDEVTAEIHTLLRRSIHWDLLIRAAGRHGVLPLVHRALDRVALGEVPEDVVMRIRNAVQASAKLSLLLTAELVEILDLFNVHAIPAIPYKGPVLAAFVYGDVTLRQSGDLDFIVPWAQFRTARDLLVRRGYRPVEVVDDRDLPKLSRTEKDITLFHDGLGLRLDLHWGITRRAHPFQISPDWIWRSLHPFSFAGRTVRVHEPGHLLLILSLHAARHGWERLIWLSDIAEIVRTKEIQWRCLLADAAALHVRRVLSLSLLLSRDLLGVAVPREAAAVMARDPVPQAVADQAKHWLRAPDDVPRQAGGRERYMIGLREDWRDRARVAIWQTRQNLRPTVRDRTALPSLTGGLGWAPYLFRPIRLLRKYGFGPVRRVFKALFGS